MMETRKTRERSNGLVSEVLSRNFYAKILLFYGKRQDQEGDTLICQDDENSDIESISPIMYNYCITWL